MRVLFVTSEAAGIFKRGGLGDVSSALPVALTRAGTKTDILMPFYRDATVNAPECTGTLAVPFDGEMETVFIFRSILPGTKVTVLLLRHPMFDHYIDGKGSEDRTMTERFAFFSQAAALYFHYSARLKGGGYDILHANDWHTALTPFLLGESNKAARAKETYGSKSIRSVLSVHNLMYQGHADPAVIGKLALPKSLFHIKEHKGKKAISLLREGLEHADVISTVSPTYAKEIMTKGHGMGLEDVFARRKDKVVGILNGIDVKTWNPRMDPFIVRYRSNWVTQAKLRNRKVLNEKVGLPLVKEIPMFGFVGRLDRGQKGIDLIIKALPKLLMTMRFQMVILGTGDTGLADELKAIEKEFPGRLAFINEFSEEMAHRIYASAEYLLIPSKFEPCGLIQMIAMRYGTVPIARKTGGLADTIVHDKTGFLFDDYTPEALIGAIREAVMARAGSPRDWHAFQAGLMHVDVSWDKSALDYIQLYTRLLRDK